MRKRHRQSWPPRRMRDQHRPSPSELRTDASSSHSAAGPPAATGKGEPPADRRALGSLDRAVSA